MSGIEIGAALLGEAATAGYAAEAAAAGLSGVAASSAAAGTAATAGLFGSGGALTLGGIGTAIQAGSALFGGMAQGNASSANARAGEMAALATEDAAARNAFALERKNRIEAEQLSKAQEQAKARRAVAWGKSGVDMAGSPISVEAGASWQDELNLTQMQQTGKLEVSNLYYTGAQQAAKLRTQSALDDYMAGTYRTGGVLAAGGTLLTGGAKKYGGSIYGG